MKLMLRDSILLAILGLTTLFTTTASAQSANGQGTLLATDENGDTVRRVFSFSARVQKDGTVRGNAMLHNPAFGGSQGNQPYMLNIDVVCLKVVDNVAYMGGTIRRTTDPSLVDAVFFAVEDNGEPGANADRISRVFFWDEDPSTTGDPQTCQALPDRPDRHPSNSSKLVISMLIPKDAGLIDGLRCEASRLRLSFGTDLLWSRVAMDE